MARAERRRVLRAEKVDEHSGLGSADVASRISRFEQNKFDAGTADRDQRRTAAAFSLDTFSDSKFLVAAGVSILTLLLTTAFGPLRAFLKTTSMDVRQWLICLAVALSIVVVSEIRKAVRRHAAPAHQETR